MGISSALLGVGHYRYGPIACKILLKTYQASFGNINITTAESVASSISCAKKYFDDHAGGTFTERKIDFFLKNAANTVAWK